VSQQVRVARCLFLLTDLQTVRGLKHGRDWVDYFSSLLYTAQLQRLRVLSPTAGSFPAVDKSSLVRALCRCVDDSAARLAASLASDSGLHDPQIWNAVLRRLNASTLDELLRPLPCVAGQLTAAVTSLVRSCLDTDVMDLSEAVRICLVLHRCPSIVDADILQRCGEEFCSRGFPLCCVACALMMPRGPVWTQLVESVVDTSSTAGVADPELAELQHAGRMLPTTRQILALLKTG